MARIIGIILIVCGAIMCVIGLYDSIYNGLDLGGLMFILVGAYLTHASKESLESWNFFKFLENEEDDDD